MAAASEGPMPGRRHNSSVSAVEIFINVPAGRSETDVTAEYELFPVRICSLEADFEVYTYTPVRLEERNVQIPTAEMKIKNREKERIK